MAIKYKRFEPTQYVMKVKKGKTTAQGTGLAFFYNTMTTGVLVMPATALDAPFAFDDIMTSDFQTVNVQGDITYIIEDHEKALEISRRLSYKFTDDTEYIEHEIIHSGPGVLVFELIPEHTTGKLVNEA